MPAALTAATASLAQGGNVLMVGELASASLQAQEPGYDHGSLLAGNGIVGPEGAVGIAGYETGSFGRRHFPGVLGPGWDIGKDLPFLPGRLDAEGPVDKGEKFCPGNRPVRTEGAIRIPADQALLQPGLYLLLSPVTFNVLKGSSKGRRRKEAQKQNSCQYNSQGLSLPKPNHPSHLTVL